MYFARVLKGRKALFGMVCPFEWMISSLREPQGREPVESVEPATDLRSDRGRLLVQEGAFRSQDHNLRGRGQGGFACR